MEGGQEPPRPSDRTPGWSPGGGLPHAGREPGPAEGRGALTWTCRQTDAPGRQTHWRTDRGRPGVRAHGGLAAPAPGPEWIPGRERQIEREREAEEEEEAAARGGEEEGGSARAGRRGPAGRREGEEEGSVPGRVPAGDLGESRARPPHARGPGGQGMEGRGLRPRKPRPLPRPESAPYPWGTHPSPLRPKYPPQLLPTHPPN